MRCHADPRLSPIGDRLLVDRYFDTDLLTLSPRCGFRHVAGMETTSEELQWRNLELVGAVADRVWPR